MKCFDCPDLDWASVPDADRPKRIRPNCCLQNPVIRHTIGRSTAGCADRARVNGKKVNSNG